MAKILPPQPNEEALARMKEFRERWEATKAHMEDVSGVRSVPMGQPSYSVKRGDKTHCNGCGAGLVWVDFGRYAKCNYCNLEHRR